MSPLSIVITIVVIVLILMLLKYIFADPYTLQNIQDGSIYYFTKYIWLYRDFAINGRSCYECNK